MNPSDIKDWLGIVNTMLALGVGAYAFLTRQGKEAQAKVERIEADLKAAVADRDRKIDILEDRVSRVEGQIGTLPDRDQMHRVELEMERMRGSLNQLSTELRGSIETLGERLKPVAAMASRAHEVLLEDRK